MRDATHGAAPTGDLFRYQSAMFKRLAFAMIGLLLVFVGTSVLRIVLGPGSLPILMTYVLMLPLAVAVIIFRRQAIRAILAAQVLALLVAMAALSVLWSYAPNLTMERLVPLLVTTLIGYVIAGHYSLRGMLIFFGGVFAACMVTSLIAISLFPAARGVPPWMDTWNGIYNHKNGFGAAAMMSTLLALICTSLTTGRARAFFIGSLLLSVFFLLSSESRTAQAISLISILAVLSARYFSSFTLLWAVANVILIMISVGAIYILLSIGAIDPIFEALERKPTLSGRIPLWNLLIPYVQSEFWIGYGYAAFWAPDTLRVAEITRHPEMGFTPFYSHNGLLETWLALGLIGVILIATTLALALSDVFTCLRLTPRKAPIVGAYVLLVAFIFLNITESSILARSSLLWVFFVALISKLRLSTRALKKERHIKRSAPAWGTRLRRVKPAIRNS
jgi:O-antigen ligase